MKIRFLKNVLVDVQKSRLEEVWNKQYYRGDEVEQTSVDSDYNRLTACTAEGDILLDVPCSATELVN